MTLEELGVVVGKGETDRLEFKKSTGDLKGGMESLCGFLNGYGGLVVFGVTSEGRIVGQEISDRTLQEVAHEITRLEPPAIITQTRISIEGNREVLVLETTDRSDCPFTYNGRAYQRIGSVTSPMPQKQYERHLLERGHSQRRWENQIAEGFTVDDLDTEEIQRTIREAANAGRLESFVESPIEILRKFQLVKNGHILQAAVVAFAKKVMPDYPQCGLRMARFRGITKDEFLDQRQIHGNAFSIFEEAITFLGRHLPVAGRFEPGVLTRLDEPLFPTLALREAVVNAICHRDYSLVGGSISVAIFDDRLEIASTGTLPFGVQIADLKREHASRPRNPSLADLFYRRGLIERWGRGTQKIISLCVEAGHPEPEFEERTGEVVVRFIPSAYIPPHRITHELTQRQRLILHHLRDGRAYRLGDIRKEIKPNVPESTLRDDLILLRRLKLVKLVGHGRGAVWRLEQTGSSLDKLKIKDAGKTRNNTEKAKITRKDPAK